MTQNLLFESEQIWEGSEELQPGVAWNVSATSESSPVPTNHRSFFAFIMHAVKTLHVTI